MKIIYIKPKGGLPRKATLVELTEISEYNSLLSQHEGGKTADSGERQQQQTLPYSRVPDSDARAMVGLTSLS